MDVGFGLPVSGAWAQPEIVARVARRAEELGYRSLWTFQRVLVGVDQQLDPVYRSVLDPLVTLAFAAAHTSRIRLGVAVLNVPFVSPAIVAKQASTVDRLSGGRLDLGLGAGWSEVEFAATGSDGARRGKRVEEFVQVLRTLWGDEVSSHAGEFYTVPPSRMAPKPVTRPGPPILLGGTVPAALKRAGRIADGWVSSSRADLSEIADSVDLVRQGAAEAGKDPAGVRVVVRGVLRTDPGVRLLHGEPDKVRGDLDALAVQGVTEVFLDLNWDPLIGSPDVSPEAATERASALLEAYAPA
ncbi:LLM class F420-dependent oxidoreductase [Virgisporangium aliadipatigenens]|uniref:LLM class F420-dependent oxidoreductase n=1 Tax=Virgisporangium aliadipatigenens TaxID=741659 RepID=A0A8J3YMJ3_9ACTN|nr:TIGR03619 family F420-dependent LLM class oxidoreductase [Virgisporangium aliadipatigenens]GIJ46478.1 LLM class F420-dependent oxidoreductase [Virgisporangium aliadipatigenens]